LETEFRNKFFISIGLEEWRVEFINIIKHGVTYDKQLSKFRFFLLKTGKNFSINDKIYFYFSENLGLGNGYNIPSHIASSVFYFLFSISSGMNLCLFNPYFFSGFSVDKYWTPVCALDAPNPPIWIQKIEFVLGIKFKINNLF